MRHGTMPWALDTERRPSVGRAAPYVRAAVLMDNSRTAPRAQGRRAFPELKNKESAMPNVLSTLDHDPPVHTGGAIAGLAPRTDA